MGILLQYPLKQSTITQVVMPDGGMNYSYVVDYIRDGKTESFHIWAADDEEAAEKLYHITCGSVIRCRLMDFVQAQNIPVRDISPVDLVAEDNHTAT